MNERQWDARIREKTQKEAFTATLEAERKLVQAMSDGAAQWAAKPQKKPWSMRWLAVSAAAVCTALALMLLQPFSDSQLDGDGQLTAAQPAFTPVPVTLPEVFLSAGQTGKRLDADVSLSNHTGDIWLICWNVDLSRDENAPHTLPQQTTWLETGVTFTHHEAILNDEGNWPADLLAHCSYQAYRVTAKILHWMDGEWLRPGQEGYAEQQSLMQDAAAAGAIILYPGEWPEGESGQMTLLLPDSMAESASAEQTLNYYVQNGMLEESASGVISAEVIQPVVE